MRGNSQNGGQTTKSLLTKPQCSGVPIQQAVSLSSSFPRHCLLFVCAFFRELQESSRPEELPLSPSPAYKNRPGFHHGNRGGSFALFALFSSTHAKPCGGSLGKPRVCGEKPQISHSLATEPGSPPRMRGKVINAIAEPVTLGITPAYAGKRCMSLKPGLGDKDHPRVCGEKMLSTGANMLGQGSPPRMRGKD